MGVSQSGSSCPMMPQRSHVGLDRGSGQESLFLCAINAWRRRSSSVGDGSRPLRGASESTSMGLVGDPGTLFRTFKNVRGELLLADDDDEEVVDTGRL